MLSEIFASLFSMDKWSYNFLGKKYFVSKLNKMVAHLCIHAMPLRCMITYNIDSMVWEIGQYWSELSELDLIGWVQFDSSRGVSWTKINPKIVIETITK